MNDSNMNVCSTEKNSRAKAQRRKENALETRQRFAPLREKSSNFNTDWIIGVDKQPFSEKFVKPDQQNLIEQVYYIQFEGEPGRQLIVTKLKKQRFHQ
jgi:hypothetical protein